MIKSGKLCILQLMSFFDKILWNDRAVYLGAGRLFVLI